MKEWVVLIYETCRYSSDQIRDKVIRLYGKEAKEIKDSPIAYFKIEGQVKKFTEFAKAKKIGLERIAQGVFVLRSTNTTRKELYRDIRD